MDKKQQLALVCGGLQKMDKSFKAALPANISAEKFIKAATTAIQMHPQMDQLLDADRQTLYNACTKAASDGLILDGRESTLIVFNSKKKDASGKEIWVKQVQYIPMVQGLVKLARNSGEVLSIISEVVYENDKFTYRIGLDEMPLHEPDWFGNRGEAVGVWACVKLKDGEIVSRLLPKAKIDAIAASSKNSFQYDPKKGVFFDEWWRKAAIKNVLKYCPRSTELDKAIANEELSEFSAFEDLSSDVQPQETKQTPERKTKAQQVIEDDVQEIEVIEVEEVYHFQEDELPV